MGSNTDYAHNSDGTADQKITPKEIENFCEGNAGLRNALIYFNDRGLETVACCGGHFESAYDCPYLAFSIEKTIANGKAMGKSAGNELFEMLALAGSNYPESTIALFGRDDDRMIQLIANSNGRHVDMFDSMVKAHEDLVAGRAVVPEEKLNEIRCMVKSLYAVQQVGATGQVYSNNEDHTIGTVYFGGDYEYAGKGEVLVSTEEFCQLIDNLDLSDRDACSRMGIPEEYFSEKKMTGVEETVEETKVGHSKLKGIIDGLKSIIAKKDVNKTNTKDSNEMSYDDRS